MRYKVQFPVVILLLEKEVRKNKGRLSCRVGSHGGFFWNNSFAQGLS
jgi:hypothetical protein